MTEPPRQSRIGISHARHAASDVEEPETLDGGGGEAPRHSRSRATSGAMRRGRVRVAAVHRLVVPDVRRAVVAAALRIR